jgi:hypothetical protein
MEGCREVWLTSQDMGSYGLESGRNLLPELLEAVNSVEGRFYTRVGMMNPIYLGPILDRLVKAYMGGKIFKFLHLPVQSGSNKVLKEMNRGHTAEMYPPHSRGLPNQDTRPNALNRHNSRLPNGDGGRLRADTQTHRGLKTACRQHLEILPETSHAGRETEASSRQKGR